MAPVVQPLRVIAEARERVAVGRQHASEFSEREFAIRIRAVDVERPLKHAEPPAGQGDGDAPPATSAS